MFKDLFYLSCFIHSERSALLPEASVTLFDSNLIGSESGLSYFLSKQRRSDFNLSAERYGRS